MVETRSDAYDLQNLKTTFVRNVEHELRTPLSIVQGYAELLHRGELGNLAPEQEQALCVIVNRAYEMQSLVERIGVVLSVEGRAGVSMPVPIDEVVEQLIERQGESAKQAGLIVETRIEAGLPPVMGDPYQLQHALACLLENAIKFTPRDGRIELLVYRKDDKVCVVVSDTGIGIAPDKLDRLFSGFYQIDGSTTRRYGGIGLGLTVVKAVIDAHHGQIEVYSQPGQGSRFVVTLPLALTADQPTGEGLGQDLPHRQRILVVDDEESVVLTLQGGLERLPDTEVLIATSGEQALELCDKQAFDLLITDYKMPGIDGLTLAQHVRQSYPSTVIVMLTAYSSEELLEWAARASIYRIMDKPARLSAIRAVAEEVLGRDNLKKQ